MPALEEVSFQSEDITLHGYLARPEPSSSLWLPALLICQDFPHGRQDLGFLDTTLAKRVVEDVGWMSFVFNYRGCGKSEGSFSFAGWRDDIKAAVENIWQEYSQEIWIAGFGVGGTLALHAVADDERVHGFAVLGAPVDLSAWKTTADSTKTETTKAATADSEEYSLTAKNQVSADKPLLVIHGQDDDLISVVDARVIADTYGASELRILEEGGHNLRYDPRALALLFGWLDRNRRA